LNLSEWRGSRTVRALFWAAAAFAFVMAVIPHPPPVPGNPNDKVQHIAAFGTLALLGSLAFPETALGHLLLRLSLFGAVIELVQAIPILHRDCDPMDWLADTIAILVVLLLVSLWRRRRS
jgi:hypothetical protein